MTAFIVIFSIINVIAWIILITKFKKIFSTDDIINKTRDELELMMKDIDSATDRNLYLVKESKTQIQKLIDDADRKMELFKEATQRLRNMIAEADKINKASNQSQSLYQDYNKISSLNSYQNSYKNNSIKSNNRDRKEYVDPEASYSLKKQEQQSLFEEEPEKIIKDEINVTPDGAAYKEVPLIITKVYEEKPVQENSVSEMPKIVSKKNINDTVQKLHLEGYSVDEIAIKLSCSITEVQFIIDMM